MSSPSTLHRSRSWVEVDLAALRANLRRVREAAGPETGVVPMIKSDAYGLGMPAVTDALARELAPDGPWAFGVAAVAEGEALRGTGWTGRIVVFAPTTPGEYLRAARAGLSLCLSEPEAVELWAETARETGRRLPFHLEIDTGMGRAGLPWQHAAEWGPAVTARAADRLLWEGVFTHFHSADEPDLAPTDHQWERFAQAVDALPPVPEGALPRVIHSSNSAASLRRSGYGCDLVRPGIFLYGGSAGPGTFPEPVASVRARISLVREVAAGTTVGYGATYAAPAAETWGTAAIGYGDGLRRALSAGGGEAIVRGVRVPIVGRISMDVTVLNLSRVPGVRAGEVATFIGRDGTEEIRLDEVAERCGTISYEILTGLTPRLPRTYLDASSPEPLDAADSGRPRDHFQSG
ncbi:MAG TPA: alanine racemase [Longimicrobiaceae bacterium]|nr:alanine racemase [Longimicrobiaceae bacterium]